MLLSAPSPRERQSLSLMVLGARVSHTQTCWWSYYSKEINRKQIINNPPSSVAGFANLGDETPLVNQKNNLDKTKTKYNIEVNITVR